jgi:hypothetical protein
MTFFESGFKNGVVYVLFLIGGAFAVTKANLVIAQLTGAQSGGRELAQMIYNIRSGMAFGKGVVGTVNGAIGRAVGGADYLKQRKQGNSKGESLNMSLHSNRNQNVMREKPDNKKTKAKQIAGAPTRLATMPIGVAKDLMSGGVIQAGRNFGPRLRNAFTGTSVFNRAEVKTKSPVSGNAEKAAAHGQNKRTALKADDAIDKSDKVDSNTSTAETMKSERGNDPVTEMNPVMETDASAKPNKTNFPSTKTAAKPASNSSTVAKTDSMRSDKGDKE